MIGFPRTAAAVGVAAALLVGPVQPAPAQQGAGRAEGGTPDSFHQLAQERLPAVVSIIAARGDGAEEGEPRPDGSQDRLLPPGIEDFLERFFGPDALRRFGEGTPQQERRPMQALGSGFVIDPTGYVVTNNHVVEDADSIRIALQDDTELEAEVVGTDPRTDLALLKVSPEGRLPSLEWGDSTGQARVGDWVMAIGNPFGLGGTVTAGIVSARARNLHAGPYDDFIQTDAAINRGNSGGPLIAMNGRVVGVNTAIFSPTGGNIGIGFAVPSSVAEPVIRQLRESGTVTRGWLGVEIQEVTDELAGAMDLDGADGALVTAVTEGAPADEAGVRVGDVIRRFAGTEIAEVRDLTRAVAAHPVGEQAEIVVIRDGERTTLNARIARLQDELGGTGTGGGGAGGTGQLGIALAPLTAERREALGIDEDVEGVLVARVRPGSPAARGGIRGEDVITHVGGTAVASPDAVVAAVREAREREKESLAVRLRRGGQNRFVALPLGPAPEK